MDDKFITYLSEIELTEVLISNVENTIRNIENIFGEIVKDIFISQTPEGHDYRNIFAFLEDRMVLVQNFKSSPEYHILTLKKTITYIKILPQNYEINKISDNSMLTINVNIAGSDFYLDPLFAKKKNCEYLFKIFQNYLLRNFFDVG
jgi:hypothetical protein